MPAGYQKWPPKFTDQPYTLEAAERNKQIIVVTCGGCRRTVYFLPGDLAKLYRPERAAYDPPPFPCSKCGSNDLMRVDLRSIEDGDWGNLPVTRPGPVRHVQTWLRVKLGDKA